MYHTLTEILLYFIQYVLRIWPTINCGCRLDKETGKIVKQAGFSSLDMDEVDVFTESHVVFKLIRSHVAGVATK